MGARKKQNVTFRDDRKAVEGNIANQMEDVRAMHTQEGETVMCSEMHSSETKFNNGNTCSTAKCSAKENASRRQYGQIYTGRKYLNGGRDFKFVSTQDQRLMQLQIIRLTQAKAPTRKKGTHFLKNSGQCHRNEV